MKRKTVVDEPKENKTNPVAKTGNLSILAKQDARVGYFSNIPAIQKIKNDVYNTSLEVNRFGFFFDFKNFLLKNVSYPGLLDNISSEISSQVIKNSKIGSIKIVRIRSDALVKSHTVEEELVAYVPNLDTADKDHFKVHIKTISSLPDLLFITGTDAGTAYKTYGKYKYKVYFEIMDGSILEIQKLYQKLIDLTKDLEDSLVIASKPVLYIDKINDQNPHIDSSLENYTQNITKGYYLPDEDVFDETLGEIYAFTEKEITKKINFFGEVLKVLYTANNTKDTTGIIEKINNIKKNIKNSISPRTGNPDGLRSFISLIRQSMDKLKSLDIGFIPSSHIESGVLLYPNFSKYIREEHEFSSVFDADKEKKVGFDYFDYSSDDPGLLQVPYVNIDTGLSGYQRLRNLVLPLNDTVARLDIKNNLGIADKDDLVLCFNGLDIMLSSAGTGGYENILSTKSSLNYLGSISQKSDIAKELIYKILSDFSILSDMNISVDIDSSDGKPFNDLINRPNQNLLNAYKRIISRNLTIGLINTAERKNNSNASAYYSRLMQYAGKQEKYPFIDISNIEKDISNSSLLKIKSETASHINAIIFKKDSSGVYNLNEQIIINQDEMDPGLDYLCSLERYTNEQLGLTQPFFNNIASLNKYVIRLAQKEDIKRAISGIASIISFSQNLK